jgi:transcriptional regulator with XRE-family HTH domain
MKDADITGNQVAHRLGWSQSRISRLVTGKRGCKDVDVSAFLAICGVTGEQREYLLNLCEDQRKLGWLQEHGSHLPEQLQTLIDQEDKAVAIGDFQPIMIPGLLQTPDYARSLMVETGNATPQEIEHRISVRLARQALFGRDYPPPPRFTFFIHEFALRLPVGGWRVMSGQLHHLLRMSVRNYIAVRVISASGGGHAAIAGQFKLMDFTEFKPVVYLDSETSSLFLEKPKEITAYRRILASLADTALSEGQSRELIANLATELYAEREETVDEGAGPDCLAEE